MQKLIRQTMLCIIRNFECIDKLLFNMLHKSFGWEVFRMCIMPVPCQLKNVNLSIIVAQQCISQSCQSHINIIIGW